MKSYPPFLFDLPGDPRKCDFKNIFFLNIFKTSNDRTKLLDRKESEFYENFSDINDLKIGHYTTPWLVKVFKMQKNQEYDFFQTIFGWEDLLP